MQFSYPEVLYALFLLLILVIVHLFQLRRFKTEYFTNVKFLKRLSQNTRKSSQLKKYLVLACRLLFLSFIIFAFAKPYFPSKHKKYSDIQQFVYLDNSFSMQANGQRGRLLERAKQELLQAISRERTFTLFTNDNVWENIDATQLQEIGYSSEKISMDNILLKLKSQLSKNPNIKNQVLLISDFPSEISAESIDTQKNNSWYYYQEEAENLRSVSIDSAFVFKENENEILKIILSTTGEKNTVVPVSMYNGQQLLGKNSVEISENKSAEVSFPLSGGKIENGRIEIEDNNILYDNYLYFTINELVPIVVSAVNAAPDDYLKRLFTLPEFEFHSFSSQNIDYNILNASQVLIFNELKEINPSLSSVISKFRSDNSVIIYILPSLPLNSDFKSILKNSGFQLGEFSETENLITDIKYNHPFFRNTFLGQTSNFDYPKVSSYTTGNSVNSLINFQDGTSFVEKVENSYLLKAAINSKNSNFQQSPLIVPVFYNMAISAEKFPKLFYNNGSPSTLTIPVDLENNEVLKMENEKISFIPQQRQFSKKVIISTSEMPGESGNYAIKHGDSILSFASFNYNRSEKIVSKNRELPQNWEQVRSIPAFFQSGANNKESGKLWKWFVIFALLFLILETLILKYFK